MPKQSVLEMLNKPITRSESQARAEADLGVMELVKLKSAKVEDEVRAEMQKQIDAVVAVQESLRTELETLRRINAELDSSVATLTSAVESERKENGSLRAALEAERNEKADENARADRIIAAIRENGTSTTSVGIGLSELRAEVSKMMSRPVQVKIPEQKMATPRPAPVIPEFDFKITSRDMNGDVLTLTAVPKK